MNPVAIAVSALAYFVIGGLWFSPAALYRPWLALIDKTEEQLLKDFSYLPLAFGAVTALIVCTALAWSFGRLGVTTALGGAAAGALCWAAFSPIVLNAYLFEGRSIRLFWITMGYPLVGLTVAGTILGAWTA